jgi:tetratricopeptide (TPR) repeat protein
MLCGSGAGLVLLQVVQQLGGATSIYWISGIPVETREAFFGTFVNPNHAGILLAGILPVGLAMTRRGEPLARGLATIATALMAIGLWFCGSRGAVVAALAGLYMMALVVAQRRTRIWMLGAVVIASLAVLSIGIETVFVRISELLMPQSLAQDAWSQRPEIWADTRTLIEHSPWVGVGLGSFESAFTVVKSIPQFTTTSHAHSEFLQVLAETGIPTGLLWISAICAPAVIGWRHANELEPGRRRLLTAAFLGAHTAVLTGCLFDFPLRIGAVSILLASICGALLARPGSSRDAASATLQRVLSLGVWGAATGSMLPVLALLTTTGGSLHSVEPAIEASDAAWEQSRSATDPASQLEDSTQHLRAALALAPLDHRLLLRMARSQVGTGEIDGALYSLSLAQQSYPTLPWPWFAAARLHSRRGELESARHAWREGLSLDLPSPEEGLQRMEEALADAPNRATVLAMVPDRADRLRDAAAIVSRFEDRSLASRLFNRSTELDPRVNLAFANHLLRWGETEEAWNRIQQVPNRHCHTIRTSGRILLSMNRNEEALPWLEEALGTCGSQDPVTLRALATARVRTRDPKALKLLERLLEESPEEIGLLQLHAQVLKDRHRHEELIPVLEALVLEGVATPEDMDNLMRLYDGLPLR